MNEQIERQKIPGNTIKKALTIAVVAAAAVLLALTVLFTPLRKALFGPGAPDVIISSGTVSGGDVLFKLIRDAGVTGQEASGVVNALGKKFNIRQARPGHVYEILHSSFGTVFTFRYWVKPVEYYEVARSSLGALTVEKFTIPSEMKMVIASGEIEDTLYDAMINAGFSPDMVMDFADIFAWQIDFLTETRAGDKFKVVYEQYVHKNGVVKNGQIIAAEYDGKNTSRHRAVFFRSADGAVSAFYAPDGGSLLKLFLRAPLNFRRISSYFSKKRFHPVLRYFRPHLGIDYAAASGTPVVSIGNGKVAFAGWRGGFGRQVIIKHNSIYTTLYGHFLRFARGMRSGAHVKQGQVIGYVGSSGLATGPHLDFRITQKGRFVNFLKLKLPPANSVPKKYTQEFLTARNNALAYLDTPIGGQVLKCDFKENAQRQVRKGN